MATFNGPFVVNAPTTEFKIPGLDPGKTYVVMVRTICGSGNNSPYQELYQQTSTPAACPVPGIIAITDYWENAARKLKITIQPSSNAINYEYYLNGVLQQTTLFTSVIYDITTYTDPTILVEVNTVCSEILKSPKTSITHTLETTDTDPETEFTCPVPTMLLTNITGTSVKVNVTPSSGATYTYKVGYKEHALPDFSYPPNPDPDDENPYPPVSNWTDSAAIDSLVAGYSYDVIGLDPGKEYDIRVMVTCKNPDDATELDSGYVIQTFNTTGSAPTQQCRIVTFTQVLGVGDTYATVLWDAYNDSFQGLLYDLGYTIRLTNIAADTFVDTPIGAGQNQYQFIGLIPNTNYSVSIQTQCQDGSFSSWSPSILFTTSYSGGGGGGGA